MKKEELQEEEMEFDFTDEDESNLPVSIVTEVDGIKLPDAWGQSSTAMDQVSRHRQSFNLKHGMFANTPMICKGTSCPLSDICDIPIRKRPVLQRCPIEIATIVELYDRYCEEKDVGDKDYFAQSQIKDLVNIEVKLMRAAGQLAISADFTEDIVFTLDNKGNPYSAPQLHKATEYEEKLLKQKFKLLSDLDATLRQRSDENKINEASSFASNLMHKAMAAQRAMGAINMPNMMDVTIIDPNQPDEDEGGE